MSKQTNRYEVDEANEAATVGSVLLDASSLDQIGFLSGLHFLDSQLGALFDLLRNLNDQDTAVDMVTLLSQIKIHSISLSGGDLATLFQLVPHASNVLYYANTVLDAYKRRELKALGHAMIESAVDPTTTVAETIASAEHRFETLDTNEDSGLVTMGEACGNFLVTMEQAQEQCDGHAVMTGIESIDRVMGGFMPGEMTTLAARPGSGKTSMGMQIAEHSATHERNVLFVSLEMSETELVRRSVISGTGIDSNALRQARLNDYQRGEMLRRLPEIAAQSMTLYVPAQATIRNIRAAARLENNLRGLDLLVIDYIGLIKPDGRSRGRTEDINAISKSIKTMARELEVPVLTLCQLNREAQGVAPTIAMLRDSGSIEEDSDSIIFIHRKPTNPTPTEFDCEVIVAKNRHGSQAVIEMTFNAPRTTFRERTQDAW